VVCGVASVYCVRASHTPNSPQSKRRREQARAGEEAAVGGEGEGAAAGSAPPATKRGGSVGAKRTRREARHTEVDSRATGMRGPSSILPIPVQCSHTRMRRVVAGKAFRSAKAGGDVKRKGQKLEPYAYITLDSRHMSRHRGDRSKAAREIEEVVGTASKRARKAAKRQRR
jgi:hypothetical protein